jgi:DNA-binding winged helix-turn-helix (wHTH) protein
MHVCRIRKKLRDIGAVGLSLETIYGRGYSLCLEPRGERIASAAHEAGCAA